MLEQLPLITRKECDSRRIEMQQLYRKRMRVLATGMRMPLIAEAIAVCAGQPVAGLGVSRFATRASQGEG